MATSLNKKLLVSFFFLAITLLLQFRVSHFTGSNFNFALAALLALAFFTRFLDVVFLSLFGVVALTWRPGVTPEMVTFFLLPLIAYAVRQFIPGKRWLNHVLLTAGGIVVFYIVSDFSLFASHFGSIAVDVLGSTLVGAFLFQVLDHLYAQPA